MDDWEDEVDAYERALVRRRKAWAAAALVFGLVILAGTGWLGFAIGSYRRPFVMLGLGAVLGIGFTVWGFVALRNGEASATETIERLRSDPIRTILGRWSR